MDEAATLAFSDAPKDIAPAVDGSVKESADAATVATNTTPCVPSAQGEELKQGTAEVRITVNSADRALLEILAALDSKQRSLVHATPQNPNWDLRAPPRVSALGPAVRPNRRRSRSLPSPLLLLAALLAGYVLRTQLKDFHIPVASTFSLPSMKEVVDHIVVSESHGDATARNPYSTALGAGQFVEATWLDLVRKHRPEIVTGLSERQILDLRKDPELSRSMTSRYAEDNTSLLMRRGLPVTPGSIYLAHFAGPAGAAAILTAPEDADAASVIANVDVRPGVTREKIVNGNPFMKNFTAKDLKTWAELKMQGLNLASRKRD
jgi:hypothetical protein